MRLAGDRRWHADFCMPVDGGGGDDSSLCHIRSGSGDPDLDHNGNSANKGQLVFLWYFFVRDPGEAR